MILNIILTIILIILIIITLIRSLGTDADIAFILGDMERIKARVRERQESSERTATAIISRLEKELEARDKILQEHKDLILELYRYRLNTLINEREQLEEEFETLLQEKSDLARDISNQIDNADAEILDIDKLLHG